jgi:hypothetical protein
MAGVEWVYVRGGRFVGRVGLEEYIGRCVGAIMDNRLVFCLSRTNVSQALGARQMRWIVWISDGWHENRFEPLLSRSQYGVASAKGTRVLIYRSSRRPAARPRFSSALPFPY